MPKETSCELPVKDLVPTEVRTREYSAERAVNLKEGMRAKGQLQSIVVNRILDPDGNKVLQIIDGNHRHNSAKELGWDTLKCIMHENLPPEEVRAMQFSANMGHITQTDKEFTDSILHHLAISPEATCEEIKELFGLTETMYAKLLNLKNLRPEAIEAINNKASVPPSSIHYLTKVHPEDQLALVTPDKDGHIPLDLTTTEFLQLCEGARKARRKGRAGTAAQGIKFIARSSAVLGAELAKLQKVLGTAEPDSEKYVVFAAKIEVLKWAGKLDPESIAIRNKKKQEKKESRTSDTLAKRNEELQKQIDEANAKLAKLQVSGV